MKHETIHTVMDALDAAITPCVQAFKLPANHLTIAEAMQVGREIQSVIHRINTSVANLQRMNEVK